MIVSPPAIKFIRLFRQDQLQAMIPHHDLRDLMEQFFDFTCKLCTNEEFMFVEPRWKNLESMEQLWLAFCMSEKFSEKWNGKEWTIKEVE